MKPMNFNVVFLCLIDLTLCSSVTLKNHALNSKCH